MEHIFSTFEAAGDRHVGRTVSGLPRETHEFSCLPPHFLARDEVVERAMKLTWPFVLEKLQFVAEFCLASLVYQSKHLEETLEPTHRLWFSLLFTNNTLLAEVFERVRCGPGTSSDRLQPTGMLP